MKTFGYFLLFLVLAVCVILLAVVLGARGAWYFAWLIGTPLIVLIAAAGAAWLDAHEEAVRGTAERAGRVDRPV